jgi:hypothetical protein
MKLKIKPDQRYSTKSLCREIRAQVTFDFCSEPLDYEGAVIEVDGRVQGNRILWGGRWCQRIATHIHRRYAMQRMAAARRHRSNNRIRPNRMMVMRADCTAVTVPGNFITRPVRRCAIVVRVMRRHSRTAIPVRCIRRGHQLFTVRFFAHATAARRHARRKRSHRHPRN